MYVSQWGQHGGEGKCMDGGVGGAGGKKRKKVVHRFQLLPGVQYTWSVYESGTQK